MTTDDELVDVRLLQLPLDVLSKGQQHGDELQREFAHIASPLTDSDRVPDRLLSLSAQLRSQYGSYTAAVEDQLEAAKARGDAAVDVTYQVPRSAAGHAEQLGALWDEVDDFCRDGDLLTLETPPDILAFRHWFFDQFISQIEGADPTPWPQYLDQHQV